jgi:DNA-binding NarL/FixJ family response regulator
MGSDSHPTSNPDDQGRSMLTRLQEDIAALVAQGLSNREIAERLSLTPETASDEIAHIFRALGFTSRLQIALWALEHGSHH